MVASERPLLAVERAAPARRAQRRERDGGRGGGLARGVEPATPFAPALRAFAGVAHRLEEVATRDGVLFVNDSKATNVASTLVALRRSSRAACT